MMAQSIKEAIRGLHMETIRELKAAKPGIVGLDQSASVRCPIHGHHCVAYFVAKGVPAQYVCGICWDETEVGE